MVKKSFGADLKRGNDVALQFFFLFKQEQFPGVRGGAEVE